MKTQADTSAKDSKQFQYFIDSAIELAIKEDLGVEEECDLTADAVIDPDLEARAAVLLKEEAVIAGLDIFCRVMHRFSKAIKCENLVEEGACINKDAIAKEFPTIIKLVGPAAGILKGERLALNLIQRMSGVATLTRKFTDKATGSGIAILDTRKTTPCLRAFEKYAVVAGGGVNHRMGLWDKILIKENHIRSAGGITSAIERVRARYGREIELEVEVTTLKEVAEAVENKACRVLLDNMAPELVRESVAAIAGRAEIEVSGGITLANIDRYLIKGVDYISTGAVTHSVKAIDMSLEITEFS